MSARNILMAAAGSADDKLYVDDVFSAYTYTGNGSTQTINNGIELKKTIPGLEVSFTTPGTFPWIVPAGVTSISAVLVGGGGGGADAPWGGGGAGGGLRYINNLSVTPGEVLTLNVGSGGGAATAGGQSSIVRSGSTLVFAGGGAAGVSQFNTLGGTGSTIAGNIGGGNGGSSYGGYDGETSAGAGSGGGAGGYTSSTGGGGAGFGGSSSGFGGAGGGVGIFGLGATGNAGTSVSINGTAGSGGTGILYGGGGANRGTFVAGGNGAIRIIWQGTTRVFPSTDVDVALDPAVGGMVWTKIRSGAGNHLLADTVRGIAADLNTNSTAGAQANGFTVRSFLSNGYTVAQDSTTGASGQTYVSWTFRKAPKFFDVVTFTGNGANRAIAHSLGQEVGLILIKRTDTTSDWQVYHRSLANTEYMVLNSTAVKATGATRWNSTTPTTSVFSLGTDASVNASGGSYVAYLFAHDPSADGIIQCGSYTGTGSAGNVVNLGCEPQYMLVKRASGIGDWSIFDNMRGVTTGGSDNWLYANTFGSENTSTEILSFNARGFSIDTTGSNTNASGETYIYLAIRRPNKPPTTGTEVYNAIARTGTGAAATVTGVGFAPDLVIPQVRQTATGSAYRGVYDRLRGRTKTLITYSTGAEVDYQNAISSFNMDGISFGDITYSGNDPDTYTYINHFFRRAPGFFDVVCYTGTGVARTVPHNLGVAPELMIVKRRNTSALWPVYSATLAVNMMLQLEATWGAGGDSGGGAWNLTRPTATVFSLGTLGEVNASASTYVAYLWATKAGISKVGTYTGNGSSQTINCGFTTGARFVLIKRTDSTGDWYVWDSARGIVSGNDPHLSLNTTNAEVTTNDSIDPDPSGFIVNQVAATNINVSGGAYIFLAIA